MFLLVIPMAAWAGLLIYLLASAAPHLSAAGPRRCLPGLFLYMLAMIADRFPSTAVIRRILPTGTVDLLDRVLFVDRFLLAGFVLVIVLALTLLFRYTRFGLATRASAENQKGAVLLGLDPDYIAAVNWMMATVLAVVAMILIGSITLSLDAAQFSLLIVPALAAVLVGGFKSFVLTTVAGLAIGMTQSLMLSWQTDADWLPDIGLQAGLPFLVIIVTMMILAASPRPTWFARPVPLPGSTDAPAPRGDHRRAGGRRVGRPARPQQRLATGHHHHHRLDPDRPLGRARHRLGRNSISLAQMAFAGVAAFALIRWSESAGLPFPLAPLLAAVVAMAVGILVGFPAVRVRGHEPGHRHHRRRLPPWRNSSSSGTGPRRISASADVGRSPMFVDLAIGS